MRALREGEVAIQIWCKTDPVGADLEGLVHEIVEAIKCDLELGKVSEIEGPTPHLPDFFSDLYGTIYGWIIYIAATDPVALKRFLMKLEEDGGERRVDIDVFVDYFTKISRKDI